jgi:hypothetical protein
MEGQREYNTGGKLTQSILHVSMELSKQNIVLLLHANKINK